MTEESWSAKGDVQELRAAYEGFHPEVRMVLEACPDCHKWAILERDPLPRWSDGRVVLIGDACHPMTPYMAQGAATSIEDAAVLARCLQADGDDSRRRSGATRPIASRAPRASRRSRAPTPGCRGGDEDTSWLYGYDAWNVAAGRDYEAAAEAGGGQRRRLLIIKIDRHGVTAWSVRQRRMAVCRGRSPPRSRVGRSRCGRTALLLVRAWSASRSRPGICARASSWAARRCSTRSTRCRWPSCCRS